MTQTAFPLRIATGQAFCNRVEERAKLIKFIQSGHHIWLQAHRRHGKTSLLLQVEQDSIANNERIALHRIDLAFSISQDEIIRLLCKGASELIVKTIQLAQRLNNTDLLSVIAMHMQKHLNTLSPSIAFERGMPTIKLMAPPSIEMLQKILMHLDQVATENNIKVAFVIDEFQQIGKGGKKDNNFVIEGVIRHCLELAQQVSYIFCGSENTLMEQVMTNPERPLYNHTIHINLDRISAESYTLHIGALWNEKYQSVMPEILIEAIMEHTQRHPYYVNLLCTKLWILPDTPTLDDVHLQWQTIVQDEEKHHKQTALKLTENELSVLKSLSKAPTKEPTGKEFSNSVTVPPGSIMKTFKQLIELDLIYKKDSAYYVINPVLASLLKAS